MVGAQKERSPLDILVVTAMDTLNELIDASRMFQRKAVDVQKAAKDVQEAAENVKSDIRTEHGGGEDDERA